MNFEIKQEEIEICRKQWDRIVHYQNECFGMKLFLRLLDLHPEYLCMFGFALNEEYHQAERLRAHGINVMYMLNMLFDNLDDIDMIDELLCKLARLHLMRGVQKSWFDDIVAPFEYVIEDFQRKLQIEHPDLIGKVFVFLKNRIQEFYDNNLAEVLFDENSDVSE